MDWPEALDEFLLLKKLTESRNCEALKITADCQKLCQELNLTKVWRVETGPN